LIHGGYLLAVVGLAFWLRWLYAINVGVHVDEFSTLWASRQVLTSGAPIMPSGVLYTRGLFSTYIIAAFGALFGLTYTVGRAPSIFFGVATVIALFWLAWRGWNPRVAWLAAIMLAMLPEAIEASGRARFYAPLSLWSLLAVGILFLTVRHQPGRQVDGDQDPALRYRNHILFGLCFAASIFSQEATVLLYPPLILGMIGWRGVRYLFRPPVLAGQLIGIAAIGLRFLIEQVGQPGQLETIQSGSPYLTLAVDIPHAWRSFSGLFVSPTRLPVSIFALIAVAVALFALWKGRWRIHDLSPYHQATLWYGVQFFFVFAVLLTIVGPDWRHPRYLLFIQQFWLLLGAAGVVLLIDRTLAGRTGRWVATAVVTAAIALIMWPDAIDITHARMSGYDAAFAYAVEHRQPGDIVMTPQAAGCAFAFDESCDYWMRQEGYEPFVTRRDGQYVDRWTGAPLLDSAEQLEAVLQSGQRVWMIIDGDRLATTFDLDFVGMVEEQFHSVYRKAKTNVLLAEGWQDIPAYAVNETYGEPPAWANLALVGWERSEAASSTPLAVRLYWRQLATVDEDIHTSLRLVARDGTQIARTDGPLDQGLLSLSDLEEGTFPEFKPLVVPEVAPGLYRLDVVAYDSETQDPIGPPIAVDWIQIGANDLPGAHIPDASWNEGLTLVGLDRLPARLTTNEPLALRMAWRTAQPLERDYTVFVHLIGPDGTIVAQRDQAPLNGFYPTSRWIASKPGDEAHASTERAMIVTDMYELELPSPLASGEYRLLVGWYDSATGERLSTTDGRDEVELGTWQVK
jgi:4-amino-4-deoxy-L-arabinose transferase-like glycosyltransferase